MLPYTSAIIAHQELFYRNAYSNLLLNMFNLNNVITVANATQLLQSLKPADLQLIFINALLPGLNMAALCSQVMQLQPQGTIVILLPYCSSQLMVQLVQCSVPGIIPTGSEEKVKECLDCIAGGEIFYLVRSGADEFTSKGSCHEKISTRQVIIIQKLFEEKKSAEIAAEMNLSPNTVENIRKALIAKTGSENVVGLIKYGWRMGIIW